MRTDSCCCKRLPAHVVRKFASKHHRHFSRRNLLNLSSPDNSFFHWQMCLHGLLVQDAQHCSLNFPPDILSDHKVFPHFAGKLARARARRTDRKTHRLRWGNYRKWDRGWAMRDWDGVITGNGGAQDWRWEQGAKAKAWWLRGYTKAGRIPQ